MATVSVLTASLPHRAAMLTECRDSVTAQTVPALEHLVYVDTDREGEAVATNRLLAQAKGTWVLFLNDDDLLHPHYLAKTLPLTAGADVIYTGYQVQGSDWRVPIRDFDRDDMLRGNYIPTTSLCRTRLVRAVGGLDETLHHAEDHDLYLRLHDAGARFRFLDQELWTYRFHQHNKSREGVGA